MPRPPPGDLPNPGIKPRTPALQANFLPSEPPGEPFYFFPLLIKKKIYVYCWLHWVFAVELGLSLVVASGGYSLVVEQELWVMQAQ